MTGPVSVSPGPPRYARPFAALFLAALVFCPLAEVNAWPFSNWRLFSALRSDRQVGWQAVAVDPLGQEHSYPVVSLPHGYRGFGPIMDGFPTRSVAERNAICDVWLHEAAKQFGPTQSVEIYQVHWRLSHRQSGGVAQRTPAWTCDPDGARAGG